MKVPLIRIKLLSSEIREVVVQSDLPTIKGLAVVKERKELT
jgi:hypothetical protein